MTSCGILLFLWQMRNLMSKQKTFQTYQANQIINHKDEA
jgi:hypothetical protein